MRQRHGQAGRAHRRFSMNMLLLPSMMVFPTPRTGNRPVVAVDSQITFDDTIDQ
jgi:hypothetical protein